MVNVDQLLERLVRRVDPEVAQAVDRAYELRFVGVEGIWYLDLRGRVWGGTTPPDAPHCRLGMNVDDLSDLIAGRTKLPVLFQTGRLRVFSDIADAMRLAALFE